MKDNSFKDYIYHAHCEGDTPSSKRLYGGIGWVVCLICLIVACIISFVNNNGMTDLIKDLWSLDLITSSALLGLSTIAGAFGGGKNLTIGLSQKQENN